ncbi:MAG: hypothetical protein RIB86_24820 [Imperialibacter sp.]
MHKQHDKRALEADTETFSAATPVERSLTVAKKTQIVAFESMGNKLTTNGSPYMVTKVDHRLERSYSVDRLATLSSTRLTLTGVESTVTITVGL